MVDIIIELNEGILLIKRKNPPETLAFDYGHILNDYFTGRYS
jgi:ADP-ribose pyrophosphatase YjhB (NUDIX family)